MQNSGDKIKKGFKTCYIMILISLIKDIHKVTFLRAASELRGIDGLTVPAWRGCGVPPEGGARVPSWQSAVP
jgi:hypothetical protein